MTRASSRVSFITEIGSPLNPGMSTPTLGSMQSCNVTLSTRFLLFPMIQATHVIPLWER